MNMSTELSGIATPLVDMPWFSGTIALLALAPGVASFGVAVFFGGRTIGFW